MKKKKGKTVCTSETTWRTEEYSLNTKEKKNFLFFSKYTSNIISLSTKDRSC